MSAWLEVSILGPHTFTQDRLGYLHAKVDVCYSYTLLFAPKIYKIWNT